MAIRESQRGLDSWGGGGKHREDLGNPNRREQNGEGKSCALNVRLSNRKKQDVLPNMASIKTGESSQITLLNAFLRVFKSVLTVLFLVVLLILQILVFKPLENGHLETSGG